MRPSIVPRVAAVVALAAAGCHAGNGRPAVPAAVTTTPTAPGPNSNARGTLDAVDQESDGTHLSVAQVSVTDAPAGGWIAVHRDHDGQPGDYVAAAHIDPGVTHALTVAFPTKEPAGRYWCVLHVDAGKPGVYEYPKGPDVPVLSGPDVVMQRLALVMK